MQMNIQMNTPDKFKEYKCFTNLQNKKRKFDILCGRGGPGSIPGWVNAETIFFYIVTGRGICSTDAVSDLYNTNALDT